MNSLVNDRHASWWAYLSTLTKLCRKNHCSFRLLGENTRLQFYLIKRKSNSFRSSKNAPGILHAQFSSNAQSCPILCNPMDCSMPGLPVHHQLLELAQIHVPSSWWCYPTISSSMVPFSSCLQSFPASGSFPKRRFFTSSGQSIGVSTSASVLPMNIQHWFPLGWTGWMQCYI